MTPEETLKETFLKATNPDGSLFCTEQQYDEQVNDTDAIIANTAIIKAMTEYASYQTSELKEELEAVKKERDELKGKIMNEDDL